jgi:hypothetical protein
MSTYRDLSELSGYTARVSELLDTMDDVKAGRYQKKLVGGGSTAEGRLGRMRRWRRMRRVSWRVSLSRAAAVLRSDS